MAKFELFLIFRIYQHNLNTGMLSSLFHWPSKFVMACVAGIGMGGGRKKARVKKEIFPCWTTSALQANVPRCEDLFNLSHLRAVFKWLSKEITWLQLLLLVIGLTISRHFINQWEGKPKPIANHRDARRFFPRFEQVTRNCYEFGLVRCAVCKCCDWSKLLLLVYFYDTQLKTAINNNTAMH